MASRVSALPLCSSSPIESRPTRGRFDFEHQARIDLAHQAELLQHLGFAIDIGADIDHNDRSAFVGGKHAGERGTIDAGHFAEHHLGDGHAGAGVAGGEEAVGLARSDQARADVHRAFLLAARRFRGVIVHRDALGRVNHFDRKIFDGVVRLEFSLARRPVADQQNPMAKLSGRVDCAFDFRHRGFIAPHRVYGNGYHSFRLS